MRTKIDFSELQDYLNKMQIAQEDYSDFLKDFLIDTGNDVVNMTKSLTPVDTGALQDSWGLITSHITPHRTRLYSIRKRSMVKKTLFTRSGDVKVYGNGTKMYVKVSNPQPYAEKVEFGIGQPGYYMLTKSVAKVTSTMSSSYNKRFEEFKREKGL